MESACRSPCPSPRLRRLTAWNVGQLIHLAIFRFVSPAESMSSLLQHIHDLVFGLAHSYPGAWLVWCDPRGDWLPLLRQAASESGGFKLLELRGETLGQLGGPVARRALQAVID